MRHTQHEWDTIVSRAAEKAAEKALRQKEKERQQKWQHRRKMMAEGFWSFLPSLVISLAIDWAFYLLILWRIGAI